MQKIFVHADDYGFSKSISDCILKCIDEGALNSLSIVVNTNNFDYALQELSKRRKLDRISLHFNITEGKPLSQNLKLLVNNTGEFKYSFISIFIKYYLSNKRTKKKIKDEVRLELEAQFKKLNNALSSKHRLSIDSHVHFHLIPFIFDIILEKSAHFKYIRTTYEPFSLNPLFWGPNMVANFIKHFLLKELSLIASRKIHKSTTNNYIIGILKTGNQTLESIKILLSKIKNKDKTIEILFHPGFEDRIEAVNWTTNIAYKKAAIQTGRKEELKLICSQEFINLITELQIK